VRSFVRRLIENVILKIDFKKSDLKIDLKNRFK
jgi:hypothetical protein